MANRTLGRRMIWILTLFLEVRGNAVTIRRPLGVHRAREVVGRLDVVNPKSGHQVQLLEAEIRWLCMKARELLLSQLTLLELEAPMKVRL